MKYEVTYERTMEIEADSEEDAIHKAIVEVSENCADSIGYTAELIKEKQSKSNKAKPILGKVTTDEADKIEKFLNDNDCTSITRTEERIVGWLETFEIEVTLDTISYRFWCHTDGFLPNCPERSIGKQDKGTDSVNFVLKFLQARIDEWNAAQKKKLK